MIYVVAHSNELIKFKSITEHTFSQNIDVLFNLFGKGLNKYLKFVIIKALGRYQYHKTIIAFAIVPIIFA